MARPDCPIMNLRGERIEMGLAATLVFRVAAALAAAFVPMAATAQDLRVEVLQQAAPAEGLSSELAQQLADKGFRVLRGSNRTVCEIWPTKEFAIREGFSPTSKVIYPFEVGQFLGVIRFPRKGEDFRGQQIPSGVYTLRYALQPEDGNHVGTSDTRDFVLLSRLEDDTVLAPLEGKELFERSAKVVETTHPAMLCLLASDAAPEEAPRMAHIEERDWWSVVFDNPARSGEENSMLPVNLVVVGKGE